MKFTIDRSKWRCGGSDYSTKRGDGATTMLNSNGYMCCLGQICTQLGVPAQHLRGTPFASYPVDPQGVISQSIFDSRSRFEEDKIESLAAKLTALGYDTALQLFVGQTVINAQSVHTPSYHNTSLSVKAIAINDCITFNDEERESKLKELFKQHGLEIEFIGEYVKSNRKGEN